MSPGAVPPGGVSEHLWPGRTWTPDTTSTVRPRCPSAPGESKRPGIPRVRRSEGLVQALGRLHVVPLGKGVAEQYSATRRAATPPQKRTNVYTWACTREEHLHHSHNTHRRSLVQAPARSLGAAYCNTGTPATVIDERLDNS